MQLFPYIQDLLGLPHAKFKPEVYNTLVSQVENTTCTGNRTQTPKVRPVSFIFSYSVERNIIYCY